MYSYFGKRLFDVLVVVAATILLLPLILFVSLLIKVSDHGPVLFVHRRVGQYGQLFNFYKFRSMPVDTGDIPSDQLGVVRLSRIGRFIRRTNIDELPQLYNVLSNEMSMVGPRPPLPEQETLLKERRKNGALECKPGLTGLAQVSSYDGMSVSEKATLDGEYAREITFVRDFSIIMKTFVYLLKKPPVY